MQIWYSKMYRINNKTMKHLKKKRNNLRKRRRNPTSEPPRPPLQKPSHIRTLSTAPGHALRPRLTSKPTFSMYLMSLLARRLVR